MRSGVVAEILPYPQGLISAFEDIAFVIAGKKQSACSLKGSATVIVKNAK